MHWFYNKREYGFQSYTSNRKQVPVRTCQLQLLVLYEYRVAMEVSLKV